MWAKICRSILRNRLIFLSVLLCITAFMGWKGSKVELSYEAAKILPPDEPVYHDYLEFKKIFGEDGSVMTIGFSGDIFNLKVFNGWHELSNNIKNIEGIQEVVSVARSFVLVRNDSLSRLDFKPLFALKPASQAELDSLKNILESLPFYEGLLFNKESKATVMAITFDPNKLNTRNRIEMVQQIKTMADSFALENNLQLHFSGLPYIRTAVSGKILKEMKLFLWLAILVTAIILLIFFRNVYAVIFPLLVVAVGAVWSFGTIVLLGYKITLLSSLIAPLLIVIGVPNCILLLNKYQQEFSRHGNQMKSLARAIEKIGITTFFANATTAIGFLVFYFTRSEILMEFGLIAALNVMLTYLISLIIIPIVFSFLPPPSVKHTAHLSSGNLARVLGMIDRWVHFHRPRIYLVVAFLVAVSLWGMSRITTVGYVVDDLPKNDPIYTDLKYFENNFRGVIPFEVELDTKKPKGAMQLPVLYKINRLQKMMANYKEFSDPVSIAEGIKFSYQALNDGDPKFYTLPNVTEMSRLSGYASGAKENQRMFRSIIDSTRQRTRVSFQMADIGSIRMRQLLKEIKPRVDTVFNFDKVNEKWLPEDEQVKIAFTGNSLMFMASNDYLLVNLKESIMLAILLIGAIMFLLFISARMIIISLIPSLIPLMITAAIMGFYGIALKPSTILIFSIAFGIASDGTMYFLTKYRQEMRNHSLSISKSVSLTIKETGVSMIYTAVILFFGFFIFVASGFGGTQALGVLISFTLLIAMCSNLIFLPALLLSLEKIITTKAFLKEPMIEIFDEEEDMELDDLQIRNSSGEF